MQETQVQSLGWEDFLGVENGNSFQYSCLGNPMQDFRGAWQATSPWGHKRVGDDLATKQQQKRRTGRI